MKSTHMDTENMNNHECVVVLEVAWILKRFGVGHKTRQDETRHDKAKARQRQRQRQRHLVNAKVQFRWLTLAHIVPCVVIDVCESRASSLVGVYYPSFIQAQAQEQAAHLKAS